MKKENTKKNEVVASEVTAKGIESEWDKGYLYVNTSKVESKGIESASGEIVTKYVIDLAIPTKGGLSKVETTNAVIAKNVDYIQKLTDISESAELTKCRFMSEMSKDDNFKALGFESMADFSRHVFGIEKTASNAYVNIGRLFIDGDMDNPHVWDFIPTGFGKSHLLEIVNVLPTDLMSDIEANRKDLLMIVESLINNGVITSNMSTSALRKALKEARETVDANGEKTYNLKEATARGRKAKSEAKTEATNTGIETVDNATLAKAVLISAKQSVEKCEQVITALGELESNKYSEIVKSLTELISTLD